MMVECRRCVVLCFVSDARVRLDIFKLENAEFYDPKVVRSLLFDDFITSHAPN